MVTLGDIYSEFCSCRLRKSGETDTGELISEEQTKLAAPQFASTTNAGGTNEATNGNPPADAAVPEDISSFYNKLDADDDDDDEGNRPGSKITTVSFEVSKSPEGKAQVSS